MTPEPEIVKSFSDPGKKSSKCFEIFKQASQGKESKNFFVLSAPLLEGPSFCRLYYTEKRGQGRITRNSHNQIVILCLG